MYTTQLKNALLLQNASHYLSFQRAVVVNQRSEITDHHNKYNNHRNACNISRFTKYDTETQNEQMQFKKVVPVDLLVTRFPQTLSL